MSPARTRKGADEGTQLAIMGDGMGEAEAEEAVNKIFDQNSEEGWEEVRIGVGDKLTLTQGQWTPPMTFTGTASVTNQEGEEIEAFTFLAADGSPVFLWQTYALERAFSQVAEGTLCRVLFLGLQELSNGQRVGRYRVQAKEKPRFVATDDPNEEPF